MKANHQLEDNESSYKILREYYEEAIRDSKSPEENEHDLMSKSGMEQRELNQESDGGLHCI
jgi:hypothetical protein